MSSAFPLGHLAGPGFSLDVVHWMGFDKAMAWIHHDSANQVFEAVKRGVPPSSFQLFHALWQSLSYHP